MVTSLALSGLFFLAFGSLGPQFKALSVSDGSGLGAFVADSSSILGSWFGMFGEVLMRGAELLFHGLMQFLCEAVLYLIIGGGIWIFKLIAGLF